jgi:hypothetical protein
MLASDFFTVDYAVTLNRPVDHSTALAATTNPSDAYRPSTFPDKEPSVGFNEYSQAA